MLRLYDKFTTYFIIIGISFFNVLSFGLGIFFVKRFIIEAYDPIVYILLLLLPGGILFIDFIFLKEGMFARLLLRCKITDEAIVCSGIGWKPFKLRWDDIRVYGVVGYSWPGQPYAIIFFSINPMERYQGKQLAKLDYTRVVLQVRKETLQKLENHLPADIKKRLSDAIRKQQDCCIRRN